jgi:hypothetical protein
VCPLTILDGWVSEPKPLRFLLLLDWRCLQAPNELGQWSLVKEHYQSVIRCRLRCRPVISVIHSAAVRS